MPEPIVIRGKWTEDLYARLLSYEAPPEKASWGKTMGYGLITIGGLAGGAVCMFKLNPSRYGLLAALGVIMAVICAPKFLENCNTLFFRSGQLRQKAQSDFDRFSFKNSEIVIVLTPESITHSAGDTTWTARWSAFNAYQKNDAFIWISGPSSPVTIPRAWVTDDAAWQGILAFVDAQFASPSSPK